MKKLETIEKIVGEDPQHLILWLHGLGAERFVDKAVQVNVDSTTWIL